MRLIFFSKETGLGLDDPGSITGKARNFFFSVPTTLLSVGCPEAGPSEIKHSGFEADRLPYSVSILHVQLTVHSTCRSSWRGTYTKKSVYPNKEYRMEPN